MSAAGLRSSSATVGSLSFGVSSGVAASSTFFGSTHPPAGGFSFGSSPVIPVAVPASAAAHTSAASIGSSLSFGAAQSASGSSFSFGSPAQAAEPAPTPAPVPVPVQVVYHSETSAAHVAHAAAEVAVEVSAAALMTSSSHGLALLDELLPEVAVAPSVASSPRPVPNWQWSSVLALFFDQMHASMGLPFMSPELRNILCGYLGETADAADSAHYRLVFAGKCHDCHDSNYKDGYVPLLPYWEGGVVKEMSAAAVRSLLAQQTWHYINFTLSMQRLHRDRQDWAEFHRMQDAWLHRIETHFAALSIDDWLRAARSWEGRLAKPGVWIGRGGREFPVPVGQMEEYHPQHVDMLKAQSITAAFRVEGEDDQPDHTCVLACNARL